MLIFTSCIGTGYFFLKIMTNGQLLWWIYLFIFLKNLKLKFLKWKRIFYFIPTSLLFDMVMIMIMITIFESLFFCIRKQFLAINVRIYFLYHIASSNFFSLSLSDHQINKWQFIFFVFVSIFISHHIITYIRTVMLISNEIQTDIIIFKPIMIFFFVCVWMISKISPVNSKKKMIRITIQNIIMWWSPVCLCIIATTMTHLIIKCVQVFGISLFLQKKKKKNHLNNNRNNEIVGDGSSYFHLKKMVCRCVCVCVKVGFDLSFFSIFLGKNIFLSF